MAKRSAPKKQKSFEQTLWDTADKLRGTELFRPKKILNIKHNPMLKASA